MKSYLRLTYRATEGILQLSPQLRRTLGLKSVPEHSTLQKFAERAVNEELANKLLRQLLKRIKRKGKQVVAMDATGLEPSTTSTYFQTVSGRKIRSYVKLSVIVLCGSLIPCAATVSQGPSNDKCDAPKLLQSAAKNIQPAILLADAGYDAEWIHEFCYDDWDVESYIPPVYKRGSPVVRGFYRSQMTELPAIYRRRWNIESFMSAFKRVTDSRLRAKKQLTQISETLLKLIAYALHR